MTNDPISDMLARIMNALARKKQEVIIPTSKKLESIAQILDEESFIKSYRVEEVPNHPRSNLVIELRYVNEASVIERMKRISRPGLRKYVGYKDIPQIKSGLGVAIVSTSKGIMSGDAAKKQKLGGELLAKLW